MNIFFLFVFFSICFSQTTYWPINNPNELFYINTVTASNLIGPQNFGNFSTFNLSKFFFSYTCDDISGDIINSVRGNIVLMEGPRTGCSTEQTLRVFQKAGATAVIWSYTMNNIFGSYGEKFLKHTANVYASDGSDRDDLLIPFVMCFPWEVEQAKLLLSSNIPVEINLRKTKNPFEDTMYVARYFWFIILTPWAFFNCFYALFLYRDFYLSSKGFEFSMPQISLLNEAISNVIRGVYCAIGSGWTNTIITYGQQMILLSFTIPNLLLTAVLVAYTWKNLAEECNIASKNLSKIASTPVKLPVIIFLVLIFVMEYVNSGLRAMYIATSALIVLLALLYFFATLLISIFFFYHGRNLLNILSSVYSDARNTELDTQATWLREVIETVTFRVFICASFLVAHVITSLFIATPWYFTPYGFPIALIVGYTAILGSSTSQILAFGKIYDRNLFAKSSASRNFQKNPSSFSTKLSGVSEKASFNPSMIVITKDNELNLANTNNTYYLSSRHINLTPSSELDKSQIPEIELNSTLGNLNTPSSQSNYK